MARELQGPQTPKGLVNAPASEDYGFWVQALYGGGASGKEDAGKEGRDGGDYPPPVAFLRRGSW